MMQSEEEKIIKNIVNSLQSPFESENPTAVVLGSGLGNFVDSLEIIREVPYQEIPSLPQTTVKGHSGKIVFARHKQKPLVIFQGRYHYYEGHDINLVTRLVRIAKFLNCNNIILTNASGGINKNYNPGDLVIINDHINMTGNNPLVGNNNDSWGQRFPDMSDIYSKDLRLKVAKTLAAEKITLNEGIYCGVIGPSYETPAEIKMFRTIGADMVGMSTVFEAIVATHMSMKVLGISCITNMASGILEETLSHDDVKIVAGKASERFNRVLKLIIEECF